MTHQPGTYVKGDDERVAKNARQAVALAFDGYKLKPEAPQVEKAPVADVDNDQADEQDPSSSLVTDAPKPQAPVRPAPPKETPKP